jgi:hypothetical protein
MKAQLIVQLLPELFGHVGHFNMQARAACEVVRDDLDGSEAVLAAQLFAEKHINQLLLDAPPSGPASDTLACCALTSARVRGLPFGFPDRPSRR